MPAARRFALAATAWCALTQCRGASGPKVTLRYRPPTGATYHYALEQQNSVKMETGPMAQMPQQDVTLHIYYSHSVTGPTAGGIGVTVTFDSTTMVPGGMAPALDRMRGLTSNVVYDDQMRVVSASPPGGEGQPSPITEQLGKSVKGMSFPLPGQPVGVGDSWTSETELPMGDALGVSEQIKSRSKLTVKEIQVAGADTAVLLGIETTFPGDPFTLTRQGVKATVRLSGMLAGELLFSLARSVPVRSSMSGTMKIDVRGAGMPGGANGMTMAMEQQTSLQLMGAR